MNNIIKSNNSNSNERKDNMIKSAYMSCYRCNVSSNKNEAPEPTLEDVTDMVIQMGGYEEFGHTKEQLLADVIEYLQYNRHVCKGFGTTLFNCQEILISDFYGDLDGSIPDEYDLLTGE